MRYSVTQHTWLARDDLQKPNTRFGSFSWAWSGSLIGFQKVIKRKTSRVSRGFPYGGEGGIWTLDTLLGYTRFPIVRARPATRLLQVCRCNQLAYNTSCFPICQVLFFIFYKKLFFQNGLQLLTTSGIFIIMYWLSGCGEVWYRAWFGSKRPRVRIPTLRP